MVHFRWTWAKLRVRGDAFWDDLTCFWEDLSFQRCHYPLWVDLGLYWVDFGPYLLVSGGIGLYLAVDGGIWWYLVVSGSIWLYVVVSGGIW